ncbi:MAG: peptidoglycan DD-metalloendopeptidase family protein [Granulosicoccaceae bacterium]
MNPKLYVVQVGDNLSYIAWRYQTTVQNLIVWNNLSDPNMLQPGQPIVVRGQPVAPVAVARVEPVIEPAPQAQLRAHRAEAELAEVPLRAQRSVTQTANASSVVIPPSSEQTIVVMPAPTVQREAAKPAVTAEVEKEVIVNPVSYKKPDTGQGWIWPVNGRILKPFGGAGSTQKGIVISSVPGQPVRAAEGGIVAFAGGNVPVLGNTIIIDHVNDMVSAYTKVGELLVTEGEEVMAGDVIAYAAGVNGQEKSRVNFEIRKQGRPLDPLSRLAKR